MTTRKPKPAPGKFAKGNRAASKGDPRTVSFTCRLPERTAVKLAELAFGRSSRADVVIGLIDEAKVGEPIATRSLTTTVRTARDHQ